MEVAMSVLTQDRHLSYAEYLALERETGVKHELYDGVALAMAGGSVAHARLVGNAYAELRAALRGQPCRAAGSEQKVFLTEAGLTTYPDAAIFCPPLARAPHDRHALTGPTVLVEVLSPGTEGYDTTEKFRLAAREPSLKHYVLIDQHSVLVEHRWRDPDGGWRLALLGPGEALQLHALGVTLQIDALYEDVHEVMEPRRTGWGRPVTEGDGPAGEG
jgi:Uma2 family endonuclease